jgi:hypothetical protein
VKAVYRNEPEMAARRISAGGLSDWRLRERTILTGKTNGSVLHGPLRFAARLDEDRYLYLVVIHLGISPLAREKYCSERVWPTKDLSQSRRLWLLRQGFAKFGAVFDGSGLFPFGLWRATADPDRSFSHFTRRFERLDRRATETCAFIIVSLRKVTILEVVETFIRLG